MNSRTAWQHVTKGIRERTGRPRGQVRLMKVDRPAGPSRQRWADCRCELSAGSGVASWQQRRLAHDDCSPAAAPVEAALLLKWRLPRRPPAADWRLGSPDAQGKVCAASSLARYGFHLSKLLWRNHQLPEMPARDSHVSQAWPDRQPSQHGRISTS